MEVEGRKPRRKAIVRQFRVAFRGEEDVMKIADVYPGLELEDAGFRTIEANEEAFAQAMNQLHCDMANGLVALEGIKCRFDHGFAPVLCDRAQNEQRRRLEKIRLGKMHGARVKCEDLEANRKVELQALEAEAARFERERKEKEDSLIRELGGDISRGFPRTFNEYLRTRRLKMGDGTVVSVTAGRDAARAAEGLRAYPLLFKAVAGEGPRFSMIGKLACLKALVEADVRERGRTAEELASDEAYGEELRWLVSRSDQKALAAHAGRKVVPREPVEARQAAAPRAASWVRTRNLYEGLQGEIKLRGLILVSADERRWLEAEPSRTTRFKAILGEVLVAHGFVPQGGPKAADELLGQEEVAADFAREVDRYFKSVGGRNEMMDEEVMDGD